MIGSRYLDVDCAEVNRPEFAGGYTFSGVGASGKPRAVQHNDPDHDASGHMIPLEGSLHQSAIWLVGVMIISCSFEVPGFVAVKLWQVRDSVI
jgi:hypothetical protein